MGGALKALSFALAGFVPMLSAVGLLFSWWLIPLALLAAGAVLVVKNWESVVAFFEQRFPGVVRWVEDVGERARRAWAATLAWLQGPGRDESVFDWLSRPLDGVFDWLKGAWAQAVRVIEDPAPLLKALAVWWEGARSAVVDWYRRLVQRFNEIDWRALGTTVAGAVNESLRMGLDALAVVSVWFDRLSARIGEVDWAGLGEHIGGSIGDAMVSVWRASTNFMRGVAAEDGEDIGNRLLLGFVKAITGAAKLQTAVKRAIFDAFAGAVGGLGGVLIDAASEELRRFVILGQALADAIIAGITSRLGEFAGGLPEQVARVFLGRGVAGALFAGAGSAIAPDRTDDTVFPSWDDTTFPTLADTALRRRRRLPSRHGLPVSAYAHARDRSAGPAGQRQRRDRQRQRGERRPGRHRGRNRRRADRAAARYGGELRLGCRALTYTDDSIGAMPATGGAGVGNVGNYYGGLAVKEEDGRISGPRELRGRDPDHRTDPESLIVTLSSSAKRPRLARERRRKPNTRRRACGPWLAR